MMDNFMLKYIKFIKEYSEKGSNELWYRGHKSNLWKIKPNLFRNAKINDGEGEIITLSYKFVDFNDEFLKLKEKIIEQNLFNILGLNDFQIMFIAQHYGLLTPIVDWTTDPLVALFFAIRKYEINCNYYPVVYILKPELSNQYTSIGFRKEKGKKLEPITEPICIDEMSNSIFKKWTQNLNDTPANNIPIAIFTNKNFCHRISKQSGKFTFHGAVGPLSHEWHSTIIEEETFADRVKINPKKVKEMKAYLKALNITDKSVNVEMLELDKVCKDIKENSLQKFKENIDITNNNFK